MKKKLVTRVIKLYWRENKNSSWGMIEEQPYTKEGKSLIRQTIRRRKIDHRIKGENMIELRILEVYDLEPKELRK